MTAIGFNFKRILIERKKPVRGDVKVNTKTKITDVKEEKKMVSGKDTLSFDFDFLINYSGTGNEKGDLAEISFNGTVLSVVDSKDAKKILEEWKKKELPADVKIGILNTILSKCTIRALHLEEELGLPPHIQMPKFKENKK